MFKQIDELKNKSSKFIESFASQCEIEEKIDAHYISVKIISKSDIKVCKANGREISRTDLILNSMWNQAVLDWNYLRVLNKLWFETHIGYCIYMFYLPCEKPLTTTYPKGLRYIFDRVTYNGENVGVEETVNDILFPKAYSTTIKTVLPKKTVDSEWLRKLENTKSDMAAVMEELIDFSNSSLLAVGGNPEGYIFKHGKQIYQSVHVTPVVPYNEKTAYEFVLCDFLGFINTKSYMDKLTASYVKTVCNLFNDYIINHEKADHRISSMTDIESLTPPSFGQQFEMGYEYIPDPVTKNICQSQPLYANVFKVLLASLKRCKNYERCVCMDTRQVDKWNTLVKAIKAYSVHE